jgi:acetyl-CoA carboxylase carboxyltransferase component
MSALPSISTYIPPLQRLEDLCDPGTLELLDLEREATNVIPARGEVNGRAIACYVQDATIAGGSVGAAEADAIVRAIRHSRETGIPIVGLIESGGARLQEGTGGLAGYGRIFYETVALSGWAPQISVITGLAAGGGCYSPALTDFVVMSGEASMFLTGPRIVRHALGEEVTIDELGGARVHQRNGVCDFVAADDRAAVALVRDLLGYLPQNTSQPTFTIPAKPPPGGAPHAPLPARRRSYYDVRDVIRALVDGGRTLEVSPQWARNVVGCFARLEGRPIGVLANQARYLGGIIDVAASQKAAKFVRTCDVFGLPLLVLVDTPGFMPGTRQESEGVIRHGADLVRSFAAARVPRVTVVLRKAFGGAFIAMNSKDLGATASFSWPDAEVGVMSSGAAVEILHRRQLAAGAPEGMADELAGRYAEEHLSPAAALGRGAIDAVITPEETRDRVSVAFRSAAEPVRGPRSVNGR